MDHYQFYFIIPDDRVTTLYGGTALSAVNMPAVWSLPLSVGDETWDNLSGSKSNRDIVFGAIKDPEGLTVGDWYHRATWDDALFGGTYHGKQFGPSPQGGKLRHVASGNVFFVAKLISPHYPRMQPHTDVSVDGLFRIIEGSVNTTQSTVTKLAADVGDYIGYNDWHKDIEPLLGTTLELVEE